MLKQLLYIIIISLLTVLFVKEIHFVLAHLGSLHHYLAKQLAHVFSGGSIGLMIRKVLVLTIIPLALGFIPGLIYWIIKRAQMPYLFHVIWVIWIILATSIMLHH